jgi:hypothetical protein
MKIICQRELEVTEPSGNEKEIVVQFFEPFEDEKEGGDWACSFSIIGEGIEITKTMYGVDSLQALVHAIVGAEANLLYLKRTIPFEFKWPGMERLGFASSPTDQKKGN